LYLFEDRVILNIIISLVKRIKLLLNPLLLQLELLKPLSASMGVIIRSKHFFDLIKKLQSNALAMLSIRTLYLL
jgi:hypothetical protein